jgi:hypothetical protein
MLIKNAFTHSVIGQIDTILAKSVHPKYPLLGWMRQNEGLLRVIALEASAPVKGEYHRHLVGFSDCMELYALSWGAGAVAKLHGHPANGCWLYVVSGLLKETASGNRRILGTGSIGYREGLVDTHTLWCIHDAVSIHIYSPKSLSTNMSLR